MRRLRAIVTALAIAAAAAVGEARAESPDGDAKAAAIQPAPSSSLPEAAGVVAGAVLLQAALLGMAILILHPNQRRRGAAVPSPLAPPSPRR